MRGSRFFVVFVVMLAWGGLHLGLSATSWRSEQFLESLTGSPYDLAYMRQGLKSIVGIRMGSGDPNELDAVFFPNIRVLKIPSDAFDNEGRIKPWFDLQPGLFDSLVHEVFHAYLNSLGVEEAESIRRWMSLRAAKIFPQHSGRKGKLLLEEAYADYLGEILSTRKNIEAELEGFCHLSTRDTREVAGIEDLRDEWMAMETKDYVPIYFRGAIGERLFDLLRIPITNVTEKIIERTASSKDFATYSRLIADGSIASLVAETLAMPLGGAPALNQPDMQFQGNLELYRTAIERVDKTWLSTVILEGRVNRRFEKTFHASLGRAQKCIADVASRKSMMASLGR